jgi:twinkle protein
MSPYQFAEKYFPEYKQRGEELIPVYCPFCHGGQNKDKYSFALNVEKRTYNCKRGSCGAVGSFKQLCEEFGELEDKNFEFKTQPRARKSYVAPKAETNPAGSRVENYLKSRGFSKETWEARGVSEHEGNIAFPYYENGKLVLMKFRKPEKYTGKGAKAWREEGGKPVFWGMDECDIQYPLVITEGETDALALDEAGIKNVVSVPSGASDLTCVEECWEWLSKFKKIAIWPDNDEPGQEMARKLVSKLGAWRCYIIPSKYKDANEALYHGGVDEIRNSILNATEVPIAGLLRLADVKAFDIKNVGRVQSSIGGINQIVGGYYDGLLSVWTGINSSGKSTFLGQELLSVIDQGFKVCAFSGEMPMPVFRYWIDMQAAGPENLQADYDEVRDADVYRPRKEIVGKIRDWYRDRFFIYDSFGGVTSDNLLETFSYAYMRYGCKVFLVDNLMMMTYGGGSKSDFYRKQGEFVNKIKNFAVKNDCHVHLVAHPRKTDGRLTKMDVMGSGDITNLADNVFSVHRLTDEERDKEGCDSFIDVFKNRYSGKQDISVSLNFDTKSKRFYMPSNAGMLHRQFGWTEVNN